MTGHSLTWFAYYAKDLAPAISRQSDLKRAIDEERAATGACGW